MLEALPKGATASRYRFVQDDEEVGTMKVKWISDRAVMDVAGLALEGRREGWLHPTFTLHLDGEVIAAAHKPSALRNDIELDLGGPPCRIERAGVFTKTFVVYEAEREVGRIVRPKWFSHRAEIHLPDAWPLPLQVFTFWIVVVLWRRTEGAGAGG